MGWRVAVVGAGPGGVCAATALSQAGAAVVWVDRKGKVPALNEIDSGDRGTTAIPGATQPDSVRTGFGSVGRLGHFERVHRCALVIFSFMCTLSL